MKLTGISRITTAEIINRCIRSKCKIYGEKITPAMGPTTTM